MLVFKEYLIAAVLVVCCCVVSGFRNIADVEKMQVVVAAAETVVVESTENATSHSQLFNIIRSRQPYTSMDRNPMVRSFSWKNCGSSSDLLVINSLSLTPDPLRLPGTVNIQFDVTIQETFEAPLKLSVELKKHEAFIWIHVPCIDQVGSCVYNDICQMLAGLTCPKPFDDHQIPCKCPFSQGRYTLPASSFNLQAHVPSGDYYVQAQFSYGTQNVNCIQMYFSIG